MLGSADARGDLIGYPPIHQHHYHYYHASDIHRDFLAVHGDNMCPGRDGAYCTLVEYPNGSAFELVPQLGIQAEFNDVRPSGSLPLSGRLRRLVPLRSALSTPRGMHAANAMSANLNAPNWHRGTQLFDTARDHVSWATGTLSTTTWSIPTSTRIQTWSTTAHRRPGPRLGLLSPPWIAAYHHLKSPTVIRS